MAKMTARLALGTVQFGLPYGLSKPAARVDDAEVSAILARALAAGIDMLDTAAAYGEAERTVGAARTKDTDFAIITKTLPLNLVRIEASDIARVAARCRESLRLLDVARVDGLLVHAASDLLAPGGDALFAMLDGLKAEGLVGRLGVSVYDPETLAQVLERFPIGLVQLPLNVFDQRFAQSGMLARLHAAGIEVHVRSVFLQGLLLKEPTRLPAHLAGAGAAVSRFQAMAAQAGLSPAAAALAYAIRQAGVARVVIGVDSLAMLEANIAAYATAVHEAANFDFSDLAISSPDIIDPRRWAA